MKNQPFGSIVGSALLLCVFAACVDESSQPDLIAEPATSDSRKDQTAVFNSHMHAAYLGMDDAAYLKDVLAEMDANDIEVSVLHINEPGDVDAWIKAAPGKFLAGPMFPCFESGRDSRLSCAWDEGHWPSISWLRTNFENGTFAIMGEMTFVYAGVSPTDSRMDPYWALAAEMDVPVAIHMGRGPPPDSQSRPSGCCPNFDPDLGNPELLRPILTRYPQLRVSLQHAGFPAAPEFGGVSYNEETFAILSDFPNVYVDMTALNSVPPAFVHEAAIKEFLDRGFIDRIMMGTDNWEAAPIITRYRNLDFLSQDQKRGILHDNAVRFFRTESEK